MDSALLSNAVVSHVSGEVLTGPTQALVELLGAVEALVAETLRVPAQWDTTTPQGARAVVKGTMRRRHAGLSEEALEALAAHYLLSWRLTVAV